MTEEIILDEIVEISTTAPEDVYDIEMEKEPRNFFANDFLVHNSHAVAYTMLSWWCAYLKAHFPLEFYTASLTSADDEKALELVNDAARRGVQVVRPEINLSGRRYIIDDDCIIAPLGIVKGVGDAAMTAILKAREAGPFVSLDNFVERVEKRLCNKKVVEVLVKAGLFERLGVVESDVEQRNKDYSELLPIFNQLPILGLKGTPYNMADLNALYREIDEHCKECKHLWYAPMIGKETASVMVINNPVKGEKEHLTNKGTKHLLKVLKLLEFSQKNLYYTSLLKCVYDDPKSVDKGCMARAPEWLRREIKIVKPSLIVCCSSEAIPIFVPDGKMAKLSGKVIYSKEFDCYVLFSYSPQYAYYQPDKAGDIFERNMAIVRQIFI